MSEQNSSEDKKALDLGLVPDRSKLTRLFRRGATLCSDESEEEGCTGGSLSHLRSQAKREV